MCLCNIFANEGILYILIKGAKYTKQVWGTNMMKNEIDFQKALATWKVKSERNAKQLFSLGCKILHLV